MTTGKPGMVPGARRRNDSPNEIGARTALPAESSSRQAEHKLLAIDIGQYSDAGRKPVNQDFARYEYPADTSRISKGIAIVMADGISSSPVSQLASQTAVRSLLADYYASPESWTVKTSVTRVLQATNSWLYAHNRYAPHGLDLDRGYVCTFSALILKSRSAHLFNAGDTRIYRIHRDSMEQLTTDHRIQLASGQSLLGRALGMREQLDLDYRTTPLDVGDLFMLATDGVHEHITTADIQWALSSAQDSLDHAARMLAESALQHGSQDNLSVQLVRILSLPPPDFDELQQGALALPFAPELRPGALFDGYKILRDIQRNHRSHVVLAQDQEHGRLVVLKVPPTERRQDLAWLERFLMEDWVARRIDSPHVMRAWTPDRPRRFLYIATEYLPGKTLAQWMLDHPAPDLENVRLLVEQIARALQALHRLEMIHQDLRPENVMINDEQILTLIDFGAVRVAGIAETSVREDTGVGGTLAFTAPEILLGHPASPQSDLYSLAVLAYQMLSGRLPYGAEAGRVRTRADQRRLRYRSVLDDARTLPIWLDPVLRKALHPDPGHRYEAISEFLHELRHPRAQWAADAGRPLLETHPLRFWQGVSAALLTLTIVLFYQLTGSS